LDFDFLSTELSRAKLFFRQREYHRNADYLLNCRNIIFRTNIKR